MKLRDYFSSPGGLHAPPLDGATGWVNSEPLTPEDLRGHVVAYDFWTYTCINWLRTLPYVRAWDERYRKHGLIVVGIHTPEFPFEHEIDYVRDACVVDRVEYPVAIDNDYAIWSAFDNHYWPALYIADATGAIRHHHFGEGGYEEAERVIQELLAEAGAEGIPRDIADVDPQGPEVAADWNNVASPESYLGRGRGQRFASVRDDSRAYVLPRQLRLNEWALDGMWDVRPDTVVLEDGGGTIAYRFRARDVNLVMGSMQDPIPFRVLIDGQPPGTSHGGDCDGDGRGIASSPRMYQLVRQSGPIDERTFAITFESPGAAAYSFTFG